VHDIAGRNPNAECLSCGQRDYGDVSAWESTVRPATAGLVTAYAALTRATLDDVATTPGVSHAGLWLLLARLAPVASGTHRTRLAEVLGTSCDDAAVLAADLMAAPHPGVAAALGAWSRVPVTAKLAVVPDALPDQAGLDRWAAEHTRGLIDRFPLSIEPATALVFATALFLQTGWRDELKTDSDGFLILETGLQTLVDTQAAGLVAVAKPFGQDRIDVVSVIAAPQFSPSDVWRAVDEVVAKLNNGDLRLEGHPGGDLTDGHAWTVRETTETLEWDGPRYEETWRSRLPRWSGDADSVLADAPGVAELAASLTEAQPALAGPVQCVQAVTASYDERGFSAAATTAFGIAIGPPSSHKRTIRRVEITFDRPHAVIAIARGGAWEGMPLFHAWVTPD
jgi:hypothetical protein